MRRNLFLPPLVKSLNIIGKVEDLSLVDIVKRLSLGKLLVNHVQVVKRTNNPLIPQHTPFVRNLPSPSLSHAVWAQRIWKRGGVSAAPPDPCTCIYIACCRNGP